MRRYDLFDGTVSREVLNNSKFSKNIHRILDIMRRRLSQVKITCAWVVTFQMVIYHFFMNQVNKDEYRKIIQRCYESRRKRNSSYSMRAFARDIGLRPNRLSEVLSGKQGLSPELAKKMAPLMGLAISDQNFFGQLVSMVHSRSSRERKIATELVRARFESDMRTPMDLDTFELVSRWEHMAILELLRLNPEFTPLTLANRLGISTKNVKSAIKRLIAAGLCRKGSKNKLIPKEGLVLSPSDVPSEAIKSYHEKLMEKARDALEFSKIDERDFASLNILINPSQLPKIKKRLREIRREFLSEVESKPDRNRLYALNIQFFSLEGEQNNEKI